MFTIIFYVLSPLPSLITRRFTDDLSSTSALKEFCYFLTTGIVLSAFALPIVLARAPSGATGEETVVRDDRGIATGACFLVLMGNLVMFLTIYGLFMIFDNEDGFEYSNWGSGF
ncbi:hypothetical protein TCAL_10806 [Tigriopus californicus]|uniref:Leptin receptor overlapping transcript-like 1 n=1 Tax=Tigriopus californicus TaxID=6832 RepID=A0A553PBN0_TIGCA|nr:hypothetical protein TCAL_10806 [Tigriopus californicus]